MLGSAAGIAAIIIGITEHISCSVVSALRAWQDEHERDVFSAGDRAACRAHVIGVTAHLRLLLDRHDRTDLSTVAWSV